MSNKPTQKDFDGAFGDIMLNGLGSIATYIPLRTNKRYGINVAIRPILMRVSDDVVLFGGKLRVGYTLDENKKLAKTNVVEISEDVRVQRLKDYCKGFSWLKQDAKRFSTVMGFGIAASEYDGATALETMQENEIAATLINMIERKYKQYNDISFGPKKNVAIEALNLAWLLLADSGRAFKPLPETVQLPVGVVGQQSSLLNKAQDKYKDNVVSFQQKVEDMKAASESEDDGTHFIPMVDQDSE